MKEKIFSELDRWISDKGNMGYIENTYNPYFSVDNNFLNEEFAIQQAKEEITEFVDILLNTKTTNCLEIGLGHYGSTHFLWRQIYDKVITIEKNFERIREFGRNMKKYYGSWVLSDGRSQFFNGFSNDEKVIADVYNKISEVDFLFIDGNHSYESVLCDFLLYYPLVKTGGIVGFHDTKLSESNMGVPKLISEIRDGKFTDGNRIKVEDIFHSNYLGISYFIK
jgi:cephalosporin hydroxylase